MQRLATLVLAASFSISALVGMGRGASATPFSDVPANHWAYQYIQSLAADGLIDGYPDGNFKGDRPLSRYEMAAVVARVIAKLQANGANLASKADLDKLQKLIDALKDELDALGVRVTNLEDALDALDKRTKFAQSIAFHGTIIDNNTSRQRTQFPRTVTNTTGATVQPYYGGPIANGRSGGPDPIVSTAFQSSPDNNSPLEAAGGPQTILRFDDRFNFVYTINENLTVSLPFRIISNEFGGDFTTSTKYQIVPDVVVTVAKAGAITNLVMRDGMLDNLRSSRLGLTYRAPDASQQSTFGYATQPYPKGFSFAGILNGLTDFQFSFTRLDITEIDNLQNVLDPSIIDQGPTNPLFYTTRPQGGYVQTGAPGATSGALTTDTFNAGNGTLGNAYLRKKGVAGSVYISAYSTPSGTTTYNSNGQVTGGTTPLPGFYYLDAQNQVVFTSPLPAGSQVSITYVGLTETNNQQLQRYQYSGRINHKIKGLPGAEIGLSYNRIYDDDNLGTTGDLTAFGPQAVNANAAAQGYGELSNTVFGLDAQLPLGFVKLGDRTAPPILFGEMSQSKFSADYRNTPTVSDTAGVVGLRLKFHATSATLQFQSVGVNFFDGAPIRYFGNAPALYQNYNGDFLPGFFGFANNIGINQTFDRSVNAALPGRSTTSGNPALTFLYPVFNPFVAGGPSYFSAFAPNTQGESATITTPIRIGELNISTRLFAQHLSEIQANANANATFGPQFPSAVRATFDKVDLGGTFNVPAFGKQLALNLSGSLEHLRRNDRTAQVYIPYSLTAGGYDPASLAAYQTLGGAVSATGTPNAAGASAVLYYPNYVNEYHTTVIVGGTIPVSRDLVLGARYNTQVFYGSYGTTVSPNIGQSKNQFDTMLTYNVPKTTSSVGFIYRKATYRAGEAGLANYNLSQDREDVNFTVRF